MNPKLKALYKELPWLATLKKEIGNPEIVKVQRLDAENIQRWTGEKNHGEEFYWVKGYFFDKKGNPISKIIPKKLPGIVFFFKRLWDSFSRTFLEVYSVKDYLTIETALGECPRRNDVQYVILFGVDYQQGSGRHLCVYKMPRNQTANELLRELDGAREQEVTVALSE